MKGFSLMRVSTAWKESFEVLDVLNPYFFRHYKSTRSVYFRYFSRCSHYYETCLKSYFLKFSLEYLFQGFVSLWLTSLSMTDDYCYSVCMCPQYDWRGGRRLPNACVWKVIPPNTRKNLFKMTKKRPPNTNIYSPSLSSLKECIYMTMSYIMTTYCTSLVAITRVAGISTLPFSPQNNPYLLILSQQMMKLRLRVVRVLRLLLWVRWRSGIQRQVFWSYTTHPFYETTLILLVVRS